MADHVYAEREPWTYFVDVDVVAHVDVDGCCHPLDEPSFERSRISTVGNT